MVGGDEQTRLPRRPPPQRWWVVTVSLSLLLFPSSTGGKWQFEFEPETRPLPTALAPEGERWGGGREVGSAGHERRGTVRRGSMYLCLAQRLLCVGSVVVACSMCGV